MQTHPTVKMLALVFMLIGLVLVSDAGHHQQGVHFSTVFALCRVSNLRMKFKRFTKWCSLGETIPFVKEGERVIEQANGLAAAGAAW